MKSFQFRAGLICAAYGVLHVAAQLSARLFAVSPGISIWYPPAGLALSLLLMLGPRAAPIVFLTNATMAFLMPGYFRWWAPIMFPAIITANYTAVAWLIRRYIGQPLLPGTARGTFLFGAAIVCAPIGAAMAGEGMLVLTGDLAVDKVPRAIALWWLGDVSGILTLLPLFMVFVAPWLEGKAHPAQGWTWKPRALLALLIETAALLGSLWFAFSHKNELPHSTLYICFLPLIWICLRHGLPGATLATLVLTIGALVGMHHTVMPSGPYLVSYLLFGLTVAVLGLGLGSAVKRRNDAVTELTESRARFDRVIEGAQVGLWDWNVATDEIVVNQRCADLLHLDPAQRHTRARWEDAIHPSDRLRTRAALESHLAGGSVLYECEYRIHTGDGRWRWIHSRGSVVRRTSDQRPELVSGTHADVTERKLAESAAKRLLTIVEASTDFVLTIDAHGRVVYTNSALQRLLGAAAGQNYAGLPFTSVFPPKVADLLQTEILPKALAQGVWQGEVALRDPAQHEIPTSVIAMVQRADENQAALISFVMRDISAQKKAEAANLERERKILQVQKAESLSVLTGGIAHDFNNLLTAIIGNAALMREDAGPAANEHSPVAQIEIAAMRAAELCSSMLAYSGRVHVTPVELDFNRLVDESRELIQPSLHKKIRVETNLTPELPQIKGAPSQLQQAIINLAFNANDAIGDNPGVITIRTYLRKPDAPGFAVTENRTSRLAPMVVLEVEDTGCGVPPELRQRVFEPFFTTKPNGHGLGLAAVNGIVRAHRGWISVHDATPRGTIFRVQLPAIEPTLVADVATVHRDGWQGEGLALIVDDEPLVRDVVSRLVKRLGFTVVTAENGADGVAKFQEHHTRLQFVLTDLTMPKMNGDEAMIEMRRINPNVPVIVMSGYPDKLATDHFALTSPTALLVKPIRLGVLEKTLARVFGTS
jgi:PAS domain S-box-containing protein